MEKACWGCVLRRAFASFLTAVVLTYSPSAFAQSTATTTDDHDEDIYVSVFVGSSIDSFAAAELRKYINPKDSNTFREELTAGFDFDYRLFRSRNSARAVWLYGETVHGARSGETNCTEEGNEETDTCKIARLDVPSSQAPLAIFRKATTMEGFVGLRAELFTLGDKTHSRFYVKGQLGFLSVADNGGDIVDMHHAGLGIILTDGPMSDSYFEFGYGRNDLFVKNTGRKKIDGFLTFAPDGSAAKVRPYFQICIDSDFAKGPDNIQTYFGLDIDVMHLFK